VRKKEGVLLRKIVAVAGLVMWAVLTLVGTSAAHFGMIIPSKDVVGKDDKNEISLTLQFTHPFEGGPQMKMDKPEKFGVVLGETVTDLLGTLNEKKVDGKSTWETSYKITKPGDYISRFALFSVDVETISLLGVVHGAGLW
jgi:uncharacterized GH25 family protein